MIKSIRLQILAIRIEIKWLLIKRFRKSAVGKEVSEKARLKSERRLKKAAELKARYEDIAGITEALELYRERIGT